MPVAFRFKTVYEGLTSVWRIVPRVAHAFFDETIPGRLIAEPYSLSEPV